MNTQIIRARNAYRFYWIKALEGAVRDYVYGGKGGEFAMPTAVESELTTVAPRPTSLGFSAHDLQHFAGFYARLAEKKVQDWQLSNKKVVRMNRPSKESVAERDLRYNRVQVVRLCLTTLQAEIQRRERMALEEAREIFAQQAEIEARAAQQAADIETTQVEIAAIKLKIPAKGVHKPAPRRREEFKKTIKSSDFSNPFEALKGEVTARSRESWQTRSIKKAEALALAGVTESELDSARLFAQKMGTDEVLETSTGVIRARKSGAAVRYEYYGA